MYLRVSALGLAITFAVNVHRDDETETTNTTGILGGATHNFERFIDETAYEYEEEPDARLGFH
jgi:hypothetical protein